MLGRLGFSGAALVALLGCRSPRAVVEDAGLDAAPLPAVASASPAASASASPPAPAAPAASSASAPQPPPLTLFVGAEGGVREVDADARTRRVLSKTPARRPRFADGGKALVFYSRPTGELRSVALAGGAERTLAALPSSFKVCGRPHGKDERRFATRDLDLHEDGDFVVDSAKGAACLALMDRNANMADVRVLVRVDLASGAALHHVIVGGDCAPKPATWPPCEAPDAPDARHAPPLAPPAIAPGVEEESVAPSGRWSAVHVLREGGGDYAHRALFLFDRDARRAYPLVEGPFPVTIPLAELARTAALDRTADVVGESVVRWLDGDALLVDTLLVRPGKGAVDVGGDVAR